MKPSWRCCILKFSCCMLRSCCLRRCSTFLSTGHHARSISRSSEPRSVFILYFSHFIYYFTPHHTITLFARHASLPSLASDGCHCQAASHGTALLENYICSQQSICVTKLLKNLLKYLLEVLRLTGGKPRHCFFVDSKASVLQNY